MKTSLLYVTENCMCIRVCNRNVKFILISVHISPLVDLEKILNGMNDILLALLEKYPNDAVFLGGDFNSIIASENSFYDLDIFENTNLRKNRESYDHELNKRGEILLKFIEKLGFFVINGRAASDTPAKLYIY